MDVLPIECRKFYLPDLNTHHGKVPIAILVVVEKVLVGFGAAPQQLNALE